MNWHRLFGLLLTDVFTDLPFVVELEKDLSLKQQFLDVVVIRKAPGSFDRRLPDGLADLAEHNLISFKSHHEAFDSWTVNELIGHYVNYRKHVTPPKSQLASEENFRLFGICARFPNQLASQTELYELQPGVFECRLGIITIRLIVLRDLPEEKHNSPLHLFSAVREKVQYGRMNYQQHSPTTSTLLGRLLVGYQNEGITMSYTMEDFKREIREEALKEATVQEILEHVSIEDLLNHLPPEKRLTNMPLEKRLAGVSLEDLEAYLKKKKGDSTPADQ